MVNLSNNQSTTVYLSTMVVEKMILGNMLGGKVYIKYQKIIDYILMSIVGINDVYIYVSGVNIPFTS